MPFPEEFDVLIIPSSAGPLDNAVIVDGNPEQILLDSGQEAAIIWQYAAAGARRGFVLSVEPKPTNDGGEWHIFETDFLAPLFKQQLLDLTANTNGSGVLALAQGTNNAFVRIDWDSSGNLTGFQTPPIAHKSCSPLTAHGVDSTTSASFVDFVGSPSFSFDKDVGPVSRLIVRMDATWFGSVANTGIEIGVNIDGTDTLLGRLAATTPAGSHLFLSGEEEISGLAAGSKTIKPRWRRPAAGGGAGTVQADAQDTWRLIVEERLPA